MNDALKIVAKNIRHLMLEAIHPKESHHIGCSYSIVEILVYLYYKVLQIDPKKPSGKKRDIAGVIMDNVIKAVELLSANKKINSSLINIHTLKPIDKELIIKESRKNKLIITVEEHGIIDGLGSSVSEIVTQYCPSTKVIRIGTEGQVIKIAGTRSYLRKILGLDAIGIYNKILNNL